MIDQSARIQAVAEVAAAWIDPDHPTRQEAVASTLSAENRFTEEALAFAINHRMASLTTETLRDWLGGRIAASPKSVGVVNEAGAPFEELVEWLAVVLTGHHYSGTLPENSSYLLPAFTREVQSKNSSISSEFIGSDRFKAGFSAVIAKEKISNSVRESGIGVAVIGGGESEEERMGLAEDVLLYEGMGCRSVALIWAPRGINPDPFLEAFAVFRGVFPAHPQTPASLKMKQAYLQAVGASHAHGEGLEFLVSRGEAEFQEPGHVRWVEYDILDEAIDWINREGKSIQWVAAGSRLLNRIRPQLAVHPLGESHRPAIDWRPERCDIIEFLCLLKA